MRKLRVLKAANSTGLAWLKESRSGFTPLRHFRNISIRRKIIIITLLASFLALGLTMLVVLGYEGLTFRASNVQTIRTDADLIASAIAPALLFDDPQTAESMLRKLSANPEIAAACIYDVNGKIFAKYTRPGLASFTFPQSEKSGYRFENNSLLMFHTIWSMQDAQGTLFLRHDLQSPYVTLPRYAGIALGLGALMLGAAVFFAAFLQRLITVPLLKLADVARHVKEKNDFGVRAPVESSDECGQLAEIFNEMLATIESRDRALQHELIERRRIEQDLQRSKDQLAGYANELERRVDERTATLRENISFLEGFCYSIAHDLRAPLRSMAGFANALAEDYSTSLDETGHQYAERIIEAAKRMDKLIMDLLVFGRLSQLDLNFAPLDLNAEMAKLHESLREEIQSSHATLTVEPLLPSVWANATVFDQVVFNLVSNGLKFIRPGVPPQINVGAARVGDRVRIYIKDNGIGIAKEHHERIFRVFERLHTEKEYAGTGIGLAIVKKGVERMKGRVWVESQAGVGSVFWIELQAEGVSNGESRFNGRPSLKPDFVLSGEGGNFSTS